ncbi:MAG: hypothetical protein QOJ40_2428 [Verrucomicrobiota bacterium]
MSAVSKTTASAAPLLAEPAGHAQVERKQKRNQPRFLTLPFRARDDRGESFTSLSTRAPHLPNHRSLAPNVPIAILGVPFDNVTTSETITLIERMIASRQPHYLVTANVDFIVQARADVELRRILLDAHLVLCDGTPLLWASRLLGNPLPERVAGSDLVPLLIKVAAEKQYRLFFLGATPDSASQAVARLQAQFPQLIVAGHYSPPFNKLLEMEHDEIKRRISEAKPDLLLVSFGCPKQEKWIAMHYRSLGVPVAVGVGATIDFLAGHVRRAPLWMQRSGTEWVFRVAQEPRRLARRYLKDLWGFGWGILAQSWQLQLRSLKAPALSTSSNWELTGLPIQTLRMPARLDLAAVRNDSAFVAQLVAEPRHCLLEMACVEFIDSTGVGFLIHLQKKLNAAGRELVLVAPGPIVQRALALMRLKDHFASVPDLAAAQQLIQARVREKSVAVTSGTGTAGNPVVWQGEITAANAEGVWSLTRSCLNSTGLDVVIDLSAVRFIDSTGLGLMMRAKKLAQREGKRVVFTGLQPAVRNVLHLARLEEFLLGRPE